MANRTQLAEFLSALTAPLSDEELILAAAQGRISAAIAAARVRKGLSQKEFADLMGVSQGLVSRWESGECNFTLQTLSKISVALGLDVDIQLRDSRAHYSHAASRRAPVVYGSHDLFHPVFSYAAH